MAALTLTLGAHLLDLDRVPLSISALTLSHAFVPLEALVALVTRHLAFQARSPAFASRVLKVIEVVFYRSERHITLLLCAAPTCHGHPGVC